MDPKDFFRGFFGIPPRHPGHPGFQMPSEESEDFENESEGQNHPEGFHGSFRIFTNPLEMESFFSQQFDEILKQFGFNGARNFPRNFGEGFQNRDFNESTGEENPRDFMLKKDDNPGYLKPDHSKERHDVEIDGIPDDFGKFHNKPAEKPEFSRPSHEGFTRTFNFGQSFSSSSVRLPGLMWTLWPSVMTSTVVSILKVRHLRSLDYKPRQQSCLSNRLIRRFHGRKTSDQRQ